MSDLRLGDNALKVNGPLTASCSPVFTGWHRICFDERSTKGVFQTAAVHHSGQPADSKLPRGKWRWPE